MARAAVWLNRAGPDEWRKVGVFLATPRLLQGRALPGDADRERWFESILDGASRPDREAYSPRRGTWEDWIEVALDAFSNGHDSMMVEVEPELTIDMLYDREVLGATPSIETRPDVRPTVDVPQLGGRKASDVRPTAPGGQA